MAMSSSRSSRISSLRIPYLGDVVAMVNAYRGSRGHKLGDFYFSAGEGDRRRWADMVRYGFISAGGGRWYSRTLRGLEPGHRGGAHIPKVGYVGAGEVTPSSLPITATDLLAQPLEAPAMDSAKDDPERCEYV